MSDGLLRPAPAAASINAINPWPAIPPIVSNGATGTITGKVVVGAGASRVLLVAVACEYTAAPASQTMTVTYGGRTLTQIATNITQKSTIWLGYLNEANIAAASGTTLSVTNSNTTNLLGMYVTSAAYAGIDQTTPTTGSATAATAGATSLALTSYSVSGKAGNTGISVYVANWNGQTSTASAGYTEEADYAGANFNLASCYKFISAAGSEAPTSAAAASTSGAMVGVGLNPAAKLATVSTCGDCHGYGPIEGSARNVPDGQFTGSHNKHSGTAELQYGYVCTRCHYNNTTSNHSTGFKNITGSSVAGSSYSQGKRIAITNSPTFGTCNRSTCHSTGRSNIQYASSPAWGQTGTCLSCHGGRNGATGNPAKSTQGFGLSTTHSQHLKYLATNINCNTCHAKTATNAATLKSYSGVTYHVNGQANVLFTDIAYASLTSYKTATKKCTNTACHGGTSRSGWANSTAVNSDNTCVHCHGVSGTTPANTNRNKYAPGWGGTGISTDGNSANTDVRVGAHFVHLSSLYAKKLKCNECHLVPSTPFEGNHMNTLRYNSTTLTFAQASTANKNSVSPAFTAGTAVVAATCSTVYCHGGGMPKGDTSGSARSPQWNQNLTTGTPGTAECGRCHGNPPTAGTSTATHSGKTATTSCSGCHGSVVNSSGAIINKALHMNGTVQADSSCLDCHASTQGTRVPVVGASALGNNGDDFMRPSRHVKGSGSATAIVKNLDCVICHAEGDTTSTEASPVRHATLHGDGAINLRDVDAPASNFSWPGKRAGGATITSANRDDMDTFCMRCHDSDTSSATATRGGAWGIAVNSTNTALLTTGPTARRTTPFNTLDGGSALDVRGQFNYQNLVGSAWASHHNLNQFSNKRYTASYATTYSTRGGWTSNTSKDGAAMGWATGLHCSDCHLNEANAHGSRNTPRMLMTSAGTDATYTYAADSSSNNLVCFRCHLNTVYAGDATDTTKARLSHQDLDPKPFGTGYQADTRGVATCLNCHGGAANGQIHGNNRSISANATMGVSATKAYRFMYGSELGYGTMSDTNWANTTQPSCYTSSGTWGGTCTSHNGGTSTGRIGAPKYSRPLQ